MKVQVVLVVCFICLQKTYGAPFPQQSTDINAGPGIPTLSDDSQTSDTSIPQIFEPNLNVEAAQAVSESATQLFVSNTEIQLVTTTVEPKIPAVTNVVKTDSDATIAYPKSDEETPLDLNDPKVDAKALRDALTGDAVNAHVIIESLTGKTRMQRLKIAEEYKHLFKTELIEDLKHKLTGWFKKLVVDLLIPITEYYAKELHEAMHGAGTDENALIEILCTMNNEEIRKISAVYEKTYKATLKSHVEYDTSGYFEELLVTLLAAHRDESEQVDKAKAIDDAKALYKAGEGKLGTDESTFITILTQRNHKQLKQIFDEYKILTGNTIEYAIECEFSVFIQRGLLAIVKSIRDLPNFYAERLHASIAGSGTNNKDLIRIVSTRNEIDMELIKKHFKANYEITLEEAIIDDTSGDYKTLLIELIKENPCQYENLLGCPFITIRRDEE